MNDVTDIAKHTLDCFKPKKLLELEREFKVEVYTYNVFFLLSPRNLRKSASSKIFKFHAKLSRVIHPSPRTRPIHARRR